MRITSLHTRSAVPFALEQFAVVKWCLMCISLVRLLINEAFKRDPWLVTNQSISPKQVIHFPMAVVATSLSVLSHDHNHVYKLIPSLIMSIYFNLLPSAGSIYMKSACTNSFGFSPCSAVDSRRGFLSPCREIMQFMHDWMNSLMSKFMSAIQPSLLTVSIVAAWALWPFSSQWEFTAIINFRFVASFGIHVLSRILYNSSSSLDACLGGSCFARLVTMLAVGIDDKQDDDGIIL